MIVFVYRNGEDCTNNGISKKHDTLTVVNVDGPFDPTPERPAVMLAQHPTMPGICRIVPVIPHVGKPGSFIAIPGTMMGGNYAATSDSRWSAAVEKCVGHRFYGAVAIHDRIE